MVTLNVYDCRTGFHRCQVLSFLQVLCAPPSEDPHDSSHQSQMATVPLKRALGEVERTLSSGHLLHLWYIHLLVHPAPPEDGLQLPYHTYSLEKKRGAKFTTCWDHRSWEAMRKGKGVLCSLLLDANNCQVLWERLSQVSMGKQDWLEGPLPLAELTNTLHLIPTNKMLGIEGMIVYCIFWDIFGLDLAVV